MSALESMPAVDVHAHFVPTGYREALDQLGISRPDGTPVPPWSAEAHLATMDRLGIATAVLSLSSPGVTPFGTAKERWARAANDEASAMVTSHPGRFAYFATLPLPDVGAACTEATRALEAGAAGIALLTQAAGTYLGDPVLDSLMAVLDEHSAVVFVHPSSPAGCSAVDMGRPAPFIEYLIDSTRAFVNLYSNGVLDRYPRIRWIVAHNGALLPSLVDRVDLLSPVILPGAERPTFAQAAAKLYYEIGSSAPFPRAAAAAADLTDPSHLLLGTDYPYAPAKAIEGNLAALRRGELVAGAELEQLLVTNAMSLLPGARLPCRGDG